MCNPYLAMAVMLEAGLEGIRQKLEAPPPRQENLYDLESEELVSLKVEHLPSSLWEAIEIMKQSELVKKVFDQPLFDSYIRAKLREWDDYRLQVTDWEKNQYLMRF
jgi:glutamine synthetase